MATPHLPQRLRDYQLAAVKAVGTAPERALCVAACGTGKTLMSAHSTAELLTGKLGFVLVVCPTLGLLEQTYRTWRREAPFEFTSIAVCSVHLRDSEDIRSDELSMQSTTSPERLAEWRAQLTEVGVAFCTYQSLRVISAAHAKLRMGAWTVMVCDEAHRTSGLKGKPFAAALDSKLIPAKHRLFYTATPRVHSGPRARAGEPSRAIASMDDPELYGRQVFTLPTRTAIEQGILSPFKVAVIAVSDTTVAAALKDLRMISLAAGEDGAARADHVAAAIALTQAAADYRLSSVLAFHNTIAASSQFEATFRRTHALLTGRGLIRDGRTAAIRHIDGTTSLKDRLTAVQVLAKHDPAQWNIVTNARCLTEGINIPALDAVLFAEPRASEIDIAQAVGRAIRKNPYHDRPALIVLALTVDDRQDAETVISSSDFKRARQVLAALESHDPTVARDLALVRDKLDARPHSDDTGPLETDILDVHLPTKLPKRLAEQFFRAFSVHAVDTLTRRWEQYAAAAAAYAEEHGHVNIPRGYRTPSGLDVENWMAFQRSLHRRGQLLPDRAARLEELPGWAWHVRDTRWAQLFSQLEEFAVEYGHSSPDHTYRTPAGDNVGIWVDNQRARHKQGKLTEHRVDLLANLPGWSWSVLDAQWESNFIALAEFTTTHGHARPPIKHSIKGVHLGNWVRLQRRLQLAGQLSAVRAERLAALPGWTWRVADSRWEEGFDALSEFVTEHGHARPPQDYCTTTGIALGRWVNALRRHSRTLSDPRRNRLETLPGWTWNSADAIWDENIAALRVFAAQHGHSYPPRNPSSPALYRLNQWVLALRQPDRRERLSPRRRQQLEELPAWTWASRRTSWEHSFAALTAYADEHGHARPPRAYRTSAGIKLGAWVAEQRKPSRRQTMHPKRRTRLEALAGWDWNNGTACRPPR
jgi:superfamily II DNA or RNA helicase